MTKILINGLGHAYEQTGEGVPLIFIHGAFADRRVWDRQWGYFAPKYWLVRYDLRGHGSTGPSTLDHYSLETFADDLASLLDALDIDDPVLCGLSWGGSIAQAFAVNYPERAKALVLIGTMVSIRLTLVDRLLCDVLFPKPAMLLVIRTMSAEKFMRFSLWLARLTRGREWLSREEATQRYLEQCMLGISGNEYVKIWEALYGFDRLPLDKVTCPTLVLNGESEPKGAFRHTAAIVRQVPQARARKITAASHAANIDNPEEFNRCVDEFIFSTRQ